MSVLLTHLFFTNLLTTNNSRGRNSPLASCGGNLPPKQQASYRYYSYNGLWWIKCKFVSYLDLLQSRPTCNMFLLKQSLHCIPICATNTVQLHAHKSTQSHNINIYRVSATTTCTCIAWPYLHLLYAHVISAPPIPVLHFSLRPLRRVCHYRDLARVLGVDDAEASHAARLSMY